MQQLVPVFPDLWGGRHFIPSGFWTWDHNTLCLNRTEAEESLFKLHKWGSLLVQFCLCRAPAAMSQRGGILLIVAEIKTKVWPNFWLGLFFPVLYNMHAILIGYRPTSWVLVRQNKCVWTWQVKWPVSCQSCLNWLYGCGSLSFSAHGLMF